MIHEVKSGPSAPRRARQGVCCPGVRAPFGRCEDAGNARMLSTFDTFFSAFTAVCDVRSMPAVASFRPMGDSVSSELTLQVTEARTESFRRVWPFRAASELYRSIELNSASDRDVPQPLEAKNNSRLAMMGSTIIVYNA